MSAGSAVVRVEVPIHRRRLPIAGVVTGHEAGARTTLRVIRLTSDASRLQTNRQRGRAIGVCSARRLCARRAARARRADSTTGDSTCCSRDG